ncbi:hypothetical protein EDB81DRAFT_818257 [Dactylonectria macrodidyma]|uniref:Uncharacterized protein n=1 Tax=Dactylonectria macrodidyma TaxID=307937 RepID=A0A9P9DEA2_9HYPO|nr:hypothetical protein EDB81DRAFT_818257 [Dactylonectria macrodidyma]
MRVNLYLSDVIYAATPGGKMQGDLAVFVSDLPTNCEDYFKNYCLCISVSASNLALTKRKGKVNVNTANRHNIKFNGWVSLVINRHLALTGERPPLLSDLIEGILIEGLRYKALDGRGHIRPEVNEKAKNETMMTLSPTVLIRKLALTIHAEIPDIVFNYFTVYNSAWNFLTELKEEFTRLLGLPYVVGYVFFTAAGRRGLISDDKGEAVDAGIDAAAKEQAETEVEPEELKDAEFGDLDPQARGGFGRGGAGEDCPVQ